MNEEKGNALSAAERVQRNAAQMGFDWPAISGPLEKLREEIDELVEAIASGDAESIEDEMGDLLFSAVNVARHANVDCTRALDRSTKKFVRRWSSVRDRLKDAPRSIGEMTLEELDAEWESVKRHDLRKKEKGG